MEKSISQEERIRRAEEIYYRRKGRELKNDNYSVKANEKVQLTLFKKMVIQILICLVIYIIFYLIRNSNYIFSEQVINKTREFLNKDINFHNIYNTCVEYIQNNKDKFNFLTNFLPDNKENKEKQGVLENIQEKNSVGVGGADENNQIVQKDNIEKSKKSQMEIDAEYIKSKYKLSLPVKGTITSRYGEREATEIVSANHKGIDIGVSIGTKVYAAIDGIVSVVSNEGDYGTHVKVKTDDITVIYAHCSKILVKEGSKIKVGQQIALSGNTGKTTGPHLHFEVRREDRCINPELLLKF